MRLTDAEVVFHGTMGVVAFVNSERATGRRETCRWK